MVQQRKEFLFQKTLKETLPNKQVNNYLNHFQTGEWLLRRNEFLLPGFDRTSSMVPQGRDVADITLTGLRDWQNRKKRSSIKRNIPPAAMLKI